MEQQDTQMASVVPELTDGVITLNAYTNDDVLAHLGGEAEETARRFGWWPHTATEATVRAAISCWAHHWETSGPERAFAARETATGQLVGGCELHIEPYGPAQVSYWTAASQRRRGHATRALALLLQYARSIGVSQAEAIIATDNLASRRVAEKTGFRLASTVTAQDDTDMIRYQSWLQNI
jgi:RimJ/RimL family protein N-acetyltransferase